MGVMRRSTASMLLVSLYLVQMVLISSAATAKAPVAAPPPAEPPVTSPPVSPSAPAPVVAPPPAEPPTPVVKTFPVNTTFELSAGNGSDPSRRTAVALTSPQKAYALALVMDGFGKVGSTREFCWTEIYKVNAQQTLTFRENCSPLRVEKCSLSLTEDGDLRLTLESSGGRLVSWLTNTGGDDVAEAKLDDTGVLTLVKVDGTVAWSSAEGDNNGCPKPFTPPEGSFGSLRFNVGKLLVIFSTLLGLVISSHF
ncbi:hypothetical protein R1flu_028104 [Riccia fluitans]|uniref:Uncharacterized protein n=1 Tax=Riccia fluitans TaxID=41844 RepID=A0ABD1XKR7_9MARC